MPDHESGRAHAHPRITGTAAQASRNGQRHNGGDPADAAPRTEERGGVRSLLERVAGPLAGPLSRIADEVQSRLRADLDDRDPDYIRENLSLAWLLSSIWFRGEVRDVGRIPEKGPVLLVGNHSGGNLTPDSIVFTLAFYTYFGVERRFHTLAHNLVLTSPVGPMLRRYGTVAASHENARKALEAGAAVLVYPGGDWEVHRPSWQSHRVDLAGRKGFIRLALDAGVPIVPVVSVGGQETALFLSHGQRLSKMLALDKLFRLKVLPVSIALPWIINIGDFLGHIPLPAKITVQVMEPIDLNERFGSDVDIDAAYTYITGLMQDQLDGLAAERRLPVLG
jgi:1-acyl-sn-glycerol-3-phosphate acyltransferase